MTSALIALVVSLLAAVQQPNVPVQLQVQALSLAEQVITLAQALPQSPSTPVSTATSSAATASSTPAISPPTPSTVNVTVNVPQQPSQVTITAPAPEVGAVPNLSFACTMSLQSGVFGWNTPTATTGYITLEAGTSTAPDGSTFAWPASRFNTFASGSSQASAGALPAPSYGAAVTYDATFGDAQGDSTDCSVTVPASAKTPWIFPRGATSQ